MLSVPNSFFYHFSRKIEFYDLFTSCNTFINEIMIMLIRYQCTSLNRSKLLKKRILIIYTKQQNIEINMFHEKNIINCSMKKMIYVR